MKAFKDFSVKKEIIPEQVEASLPEELEVTDFLPPLSEAELKQNHTLPHDPPPVLIMRRKAIRQYPNGQRVAMYYVDKIDKYVTVPYSSLQWAAGIEEETN
jgi:hypothetical protein